MKAFGQEIADYESEWPTLLELGELSVQGTAQELRDMATFLNECADFMDKGSTQDHWHYNDNIDDRPQFVVCQPPEAD
jgi:hypothetical protein